MTITVAAGTQTILLSQTGLTFTAVVGGGAAPSQNFGVLNIGQGTMNWSVASTTLSGGPGWLTVTPSSGSTDASSLTVPFVDVAVNAGGLAPEPPVVDRRFIRRGWASERTEAFAVARVTVDPQIAVRNGNGS